MILFHFHEIERFKKNIKRKIIILIIVLEIWFRSKIMHRNPHLSITSPYTFSLRTWTVPLTSSQIQAAVNYRSPEERLAMFSQLELWLANTIRLQVVEQGDMGDMEDPQQTARCVHIVYRGIENVCTVML